MTKNVINTYAAYCKENEIRLASSSGAVFSLLSNHVLKQQGVVYGVAMTDDCKAAEYVRIDSQDELYRLRGSKYMQAKVENTYIQVQKDLKDGKKVLFSGTGCQINGLKFFLGKEYANLLCADIVCHGVPSPLLWKKYVEDLEKKTNANLVSVNFRSKDKGWQDFGMKELNSEHKEIYTSKNLNPYMQMFLKNYCLRPSCYACIAKDKKMSDMTIGDFWGIDSVVPEMNDGKGVSLVIIRTIKGSEMFEDVKKDLYFKEVEYSESVRWNPSEYCSVKRPNERDKFFLDMHAMTFEELEKQYVAIKPSLKFIIKKMIKGVIMMTPMKNLIYRSYTRNNHANYGMIFVLKNK